jgi:putative Mg2+ transporter-C (MgtC) family protein
MASCGYMIVGIHVLDSTDAEARVIAGLLTGIGFIGGGAILKHKDGVTGTATAASLWNTGLIGMAVAWRRIEIALLLSVTNWLTLWLAGRIKEKVPNQERE